MDNINEKVRNITKLQQWRSTSEVIQWYKNSEKSKKKLLKFDIVQFYPSISPDLIDEAISWIRSIVNISDEDISIIMHARKAFLFNNGGPWIKKKQLRF